MLNSERETTITYDLEEQVVRVFTAIKRDQTRLEKAGIQPHAGDPTSGLFYRFPLSRLFWKARPVKPPREGGKRPRPPWLKKTTQEEVSEGGQGEV